MSTHNTAITAILLTLTDWNGIFHSHSHSARLGPVGGGRMWEEGQIIFKFKSRPTEEKLQNPTFQIQYWNLLPFSDPLQQYPVDCQLYFPFATLSVINRDYMERSSPETEWRINFVGVGTDKEWRYHSDQSGGKYTSSLSATGSLWRQTKMFNDGGNGLWCCRYANLSLFICLILNLHMDTRQQ